ncbi:MAG: DUF4276 family protein [Deltaproteobacteria bacterium]|nr:DUF4276 family protein [Deltaproteobacteria bacterium]
MITLVFFLEELSARVLLEGLLPRFVPTESVKLRFVVFEGKQDLEKQLVRRMRLWRLPNTRFVVLRDQDSADCKDVKTRLVELCEQACHAETLVRVACRELESWYLGDLAAVERSLHVTGLSAKRDTQKLRDPDAVYAPSKELDALTGGVYQKVAGSRAIAPHLNLAGENRSRSFGVFIASVQRVVDEALAGA